MITKETRDKISSSLKRYFNGNVEAKKHLSKKHKGSVPWNKGKRGVYSPDVLKIMSEHKKGKPLSRSHREHIGTASRGKNNGRWLGGIKTDYERIRNCSKYIEWRQGVFIRDKFACQECFDNRGGNLVAHHIKHFNELLKEVRQYMPLLDVLEAAILYTPLWDITNGVTLCENCHKEEHKKIRSK